MFDAFYLCAVGVEARYCTIFPPYRSTKRPSETTNKIDSAILSGRLSEAIEPPVFLSIDYYFLVLDKNDNYNTKRQAKNTGKNAYLTSELNMPTARSTISEARAGRPFLRISLPAINHCHGDNWHQQEEEVVVVNLTRQKGNDRNEYKHK